LNGPFHINKKTVRTIKGPSLQKFIGLATGSTRQCVSIGMERDV